jgi:hypothetical protein
LTITYYYAKYISCFFAASAEFTITSNTKEKSAMKILISTEGGCSLTLHCKSATDLAWLSPLVLGFRAEIQLIRDNHRNDYEDHFQLRSVDMSVYPVMVVVQFHFKHFTSEPINDLCAFIRIAAKHCLFKSDDEDRPGEDQYIVDTQYHDLPVYYASKDQLAELQIDQTD